MVKITAKKLLGPEQVYDLGVVKDHNFLLSNGLVASNCFNKSHSTAYAYLTYQTAYLKANYPTEYMTALLSASSDSLEKIDKYRENCQKMNIEVKPPNINRSQKDFTVYGDAIIFGLSAVKNLGEGAIDIILQAREAAGGKFKSLADFCSRVDLRVVNRRSLETLIYCGAFDELNLNRHQLIKDIELIIPWAQNRAKEKEIGQTSLFDDLSPTSANDFESIPSAKKVEEYSQQEKLRLEKEYLGFYISDHPLKNFTESAQLLSPINLNQLPNFKDKSKVAVIVLLTSVKKHTNKHGSQMAFLQIEDLTTSTEAVVFAQTYAKIENLLQTNSTLIIWGKIEAKDDKYKILVDHAEDIKNVKMIIINLPLNQAMDLDNQNKLKSLLKEQSGEKNSANIPVFVSISTGEESLMIRLGQDFWVQNEQASVEALERAGFNVKSQNLKQTLD